MEVDQSKKILEYCPNYNRIVHFDYLKDDVITAKLIRVYKDFVFRINIHSSNDVKDLCDLDYVLGRYIDDYCFRKELKKEIVLVKIKKTCTDILKAFVESILKIFDNYLENSTRKITIARWI